jgi:hypothetical protein
MANRGSSARSSGTVGERACSEIEDILSRGGCVSLETRIPVSGLSIYAAS